MIIIPTNLGPSNPDPLWDKVSLLVATKQDAGTSATTSTVFDASTFKQPITYANGSFATGKYGTYCIQPYYSKIVFTNANITNFGTGDFTIEFWASYQYYVGPGYYYQYAKIFNTDQMSWYWDSFNQYNFSTWYQMPYFSTVNSGNWNHYAVSRQSGTNRVFLNGIVQSTTTNNVNYAGTGDFGLGANDSTCQNFVDDFRITKAARYTSNFTPPTKIVF